MDRIRAIDADVTRHLQSYNESMALDLDNDQDSVFHQQLLAWKELNCTAYFTHFVQEVTPLCKTFNLIVYHRNEIVDILIKHLQIPNSLALEPLAKLMTYLASDLRHEFYPFFPRFVEVLASVIRTMSSDAAVLEAVFHSLGFMFKYLRKDLVRDFSAAFVYFLISVSGTNFS